MLLFLVRVFYKAESALAREKGAAILCLAGIAILMILINLPYFGSNTVVKSLTTEKTLVHLLLFILTWYAGKSALRMIQIVKVQRLYFFSVTLAVASLLLGAAGGDPIPGELSTHPVSPGKPNILLIVIDTLRADHVHCYGYEKPITPNLDNLADRGIRFSNLVAQSSWTRPSMASILTSRYPVEHMTGWIHQALPDSIPTLAEILRENGYYTMAVGNNGHLDRGFGFDKGFDIFDINNITPLIATSPIPIIGLVSNRLWVKLGWFHPTYHSARHLTRSAARLISECSEPFFLYAHYIDPHVPYFSKGLNPFQPSFEKENIEKLKELYDEEINFTDRFVGALLTMMEDEGLMENTLVVVTSDHGEEFMEHGEWKHGKNLYNESLNIPLIMYFPGRLAAGILDDRLVESIDIMPTILSIAGIDAVQGSGRDLFASSEMPGPLHHDFHPEVFSEYASAPLNDKGIKMFTVQTPKWKLVKSYKDSLLTGTELYDIASDNGEKLDLADKHSDVVRYFEEKLSEHRMLQASGDFIADGRKESIDPAEKMQIRSLGYIY